MQIFKHFDIEHKNSILTTGSISIGTIEYYRETENEKIRDEFEGKFSFLFNPKKNEPIDLTKEEVNSLTYEYIFHSNLRIAGEKTHFIADLKVPNVFVFCCSIKYTNELRKKFGGGTYEILDMNKYRRLIFNELYKIQPIRASIAMPVNYVETKKIIVTNENKEKVIPYHKFKTQNKTGLKEIQIEDYFTKNNSFSDEYEYRLIYIPFNKPIFKQRVINIPDLTKYIIMK